MSRCVETSLLSGHYTTSRCRIDSRFGTPRTGKREKKTRVVMMPTLSSLVPPQVVMNTRATSKLSMPIYGCHKWRQSWHHGDSLCWHVYSWNVTFSIQVHIKIWTKWPIFYRWHFWNAFYSVRSFIYSFLRFHLRMPDHPFRCSDLKRLREYHASSSRNGHQVNLLWSRWCVLVPLQSANDSQSRQGTALGNSGTKLYHSLHVESHRMSL